MNREAMLATIDAILADTTLPPITRILPDTADRAKALVAALPNVGAPDTWEFPGYAGAQTIEPTFGRDTLSLNYSRHSLTDEHTRSVLIFIVGPPPDPIIVVTRLPSLKNPPVMPWQSGVGAGRLALGRADTERCLVELFAIVFPGGSAP